MKKAPTVCGTFLLLIDLVLIAFVAVQFTYFFGGRPLIAAGGLTYAEYAHVKMVVKPMMSMMEEEEIRVFFRASQTPFHVSSL